MIDPENDAITSVSSTSFQPEKRADHRQQLHVAHAEPFLTANAVVALGDGVQHAATDDDADQRITPAREAETGCRRTRSRCRAV